MAYRDIFLKLIDKLPLKPRFETESLVNLIDSSPIRLDLATHDRAEKTQRIEGIKFHLMYDLTKAIPAYFEFSEARTNDIEVGKKMDIKTYVFDKGYMDFNRWSDIDGCLFCNKIKEEQFNKRTDLNPRTH